MKKIQFIKEKKEDCIAVLTGLIDAIYNFLEIYNDKELLDNVESEMEKFIIGYKDDVQAYETIRLKLKKNDFNLSTLEINQIGLAFFYYSLKWEKQIQNLETARDYAKNLYQKLLDNPEQVKS